MFFCNVAHEGEHRREQMRMLFGIGALDNRWQLFIIARENNGRLRRCAGKRNSGLGKFELRCLVNEHDIVQGLDHSALRLHGLGGAPDSRANDDTPCGTFDNGRNNILRNLLDPCAQITVGVVPEVALRFGDEEIIVMHAIPVGQFSNFVEHVVDRMVSERGD